MSSLAGKSLQAFAGCLAPGHAQACSRSENRKRPVVALTGLKRNLLFIIQVRQAVNEHAEIVHQLQLFDACRKGQVLLVQLPGKVGDPGCSVADRPCHRDAAMGGGADRIRTFPQEALQHRFERRPLGGDKPFLVLLAQPIRFKAVDGQQRFGSSHVAGQQSRLSHGGLRRHLSSGSFKHLHQATDGESEEIQRQRSPRRCHLRFIRAVTADQNPLPKAVFDAGMGVSAHLVGFQKHRPSLFRTRQQAMSRPILFFLQISQSVDSLVCGLRHDSDGEPVARFHAVNQFTHHVFAI
ncbi:MAG: Uncharacterised protein [Synechococcus sp. CC9902]|nr:MAG: Uncharacterised protein [Synechococcus sp. CC9902]